MITLDAVELAEQSETMWRVAVPSPQKIIFLSESQIILTVVRIKT